MNAPPPFRTRVRKVRNATRAVPRPVRRRAAPRLGKVTGRGMYKGFGRDVGTVIGGAIGGYAGVPQLAGLGGRIGAYASKITGYGAYNVSRNSLIMQDPPEIMNSRYKEGAVIVRHREYLTDIISSQDFTIQASVDVNPGLLSSFPWLSQVANAFEEWEPSGMIFEFVTSSGSALTGTNPSLGEVMISSQYNSYAPAFTTKQQMLNQIFATSTVPSANSMHPLECKPSQNQVTRFYTRDGAAVGDTRLYDLCRTTVATSGQLASGNNLGELWVTYEVCFYKPKLQIVEDLVAPVAHYNFGYPASPISGTTPLFGDTSATPSSVNPDPFGIVWAANRLGFTVPALQGDKFTGVLVMSGLMAVGDSVFGISSPFSGTNCIIGPAGSNSTQAPELINVNQTTGAINSPPTVPTAVSCATSFTINVTDPTLPWSVVWEPTGVPPLNVNYPKSPGMDFYLWKEL